MNMKKRKAHIHIWRVIPKQHSDTSQNERFYCQECLKTVDLLSGGFEKPKLVVVYEELSKVYLS